MKFILDALRDTPSGLFSMDDTTPLQDYSPFNRVATITGGTPVQHAGLVAGAAWAPVFTSTITAAFDSPVFTRGFESKPFTLGAWVRVITAAGTGDQQVLGNSGQMDGITVNGTVVSFVTKYTSSGEARCTYDLQRSRAVPIFAVHAATKNSLYIDGQLVDEVILTDAQQLDTYASTSANLICGTTAGSQKIAVNGVSYFPVALDPQSIARLVEVGNDLPDTENVVINNKGNHIETSLNNMLLFEDRLVTTPEQWSQGLFDNVAVVHEELVPTFIGSTSVAGHWTTAMNLDATALTSLYGCQFNWDGQGATVDVSVDSGTTWETVSRGRNCATIPNGFNPVGKILQVRVNFAGGIVDDPSYIDNLSLIGMKSAVSNVLHGRTLTYTAASPNRNYLPTDYDDNWGVDIASGGSVVVSADTLSASPARTIELWIKRQGANPTLSMTGTTYQNGVGGTATLVDGQWTLLHVAAGADVTGSITINGPCKVGHVGIYTTVLTPAQVAFIYAQYTGTDTKRFLSDGSIVVSESPTAAQLYSYDWSIAASG